MAFRGFPVEAVEFYEGLLADNSKTYWQAHKATYDADVQGPMKELLAEVAGEFGNGKIFRPYRDVRFSADKTPYKTHIGAILDSGGYVQLGADGLAAGRGGLDPPGGPPGRVPAGRGDHAPGKKIAASLAAPGGGRA